MKKKINSGDDYGLQGKKNFSTSRPNKYRENQNCLGIHEIM